MEEYKISAASSLRILKSAAAFNSSEASFSPSLRRPTTNAPTDDEISIFDARQYFSDNPDRKAAASLPPLPPRAVGRCTERSAPTAVSYSPSRLSSVSSLDGYSRSYRSGFRSGSFRATPTTSSEVSWNSRIGLLSIRPGPTAVSFKDLASTKEQQRSHKKPKGWTLYRKCPCSGRKSVAVEENSSEYRKPTAHQSSSFSDPNLNLKREDSGSTPQTQSEKATVKLASAGRGNWAKTSADALPLEELGCLIVRSESSVANTGFSFPMLNPPSAAGKFAQASDANIAEEARREHLELFRPNEAIGFPQMHAGFWNQSSNVVLQFSSHGVRRNIALAMNPQEDDATSDSSSDLFEIDSLSMPATVACRRRDSIDEVAPQPLPQHLRQRLEEGENWYEPSEASVEWSVATAEALDGRSSAANFSVSASEIGFPGSAAAVSTGGFVEGPSRRKAGGGGILSCRREKAVSVGPHPVKCGPESFRTGPTSTSLETARIAAMSKLAGGNLARASGVSHTLTHYSAL